MKLDYNFIHFRKTTSVEFANDFKDFSDWLYLKNANNEYVNILQIDDASKSVVLNPLREKTYPVFENVASDSSLNNAYFLDDIRLIYLRGIPYECPMDYITSAEYTDSSVISVDPKRHVLLIPDPAKSVKVDDSQLNVAFIHQTDSTGTYNPDSKDSSITIYVKGDAYKNKVFTIKESNPVGSTTDGVDEKTWWGLRNYIDSRLKDVDVEEIIDTEWKDER